MSGKRPMGPWMQPVNENAQKLHFYNSLTRKKELFVPQTGNRVSWYSCGPTVYDASHMGHARSYVSFDILRRVLRDYFKYDITYCMNITDIDDKIIRRARQNRLFQEFISTERSVKELLEVLSEPIELYRGKLAEETDEAKKVMYTRILKSADEGLNELKSADNSGPAGLQKEVLLKCKDPLSEYLDKKYGADVIDNDIFFELPKHFEGEYFKDMDDLNVLLPDMLTRVTEFVPEIIEYVEKIISNGFAYEANGSVYFNTNKFSQDEKHYYAKLVPEAFGDSGALQEGEGDLILTSDRLSEKRSPNDFALWKQSKPGEPSWVSPWGRGRPGWHIECSVMASITLGNSIDIHTGGFDLKFPHHDNELAQAEAYYGHSHWVHYFLHTGHLTIDGMKMSKSLKNFTSIQDALKAHTSTQIRFAFLLHSWKDTLDYSDKTMEIALLYEKTFKEFFLNTKSTLRHLPSSGSDMFRKWTELETKLHNSFLSAKSAVHASLCDSVDTRGALESMRELVSATNIYSKSVQTTGARADYTLLKNIAVYLTDMLRIFGAISSASDSIGFPSSSTGVTSNLEETILPYLDCLSDFREEIRQNAVATKDSEALRLCDVLRDERLPQLGVRLEDVEGNKPVIKLEDRDSLLRELEEKKKQQELEAAKKAAKKQLADAEKAAREEQKKMAPEKMFLCQTDKYSKFDENGIPTHEADGKEITKSGRKKLQKQYDAQAKKYQAYLKESQGDS